MKGIVKILRNASKHPIKIKTEINTPKTAELISEQNQIGISN